MNQVSAIFFNTLLTVWLASGAVANGASNDSTTIDVLDPKSCIPGAEMYYAKNEQEQDDVMGGIIQEKRKPDAVVVRFDPATLTVHFKRSNGSMDKIKISDPGAEKWTVVNRTTKSARPAAENKTSAITWQTSWDAFLTFAEQELNRLPPNAAGPWEGKEVLWEGTVSDMEIMTAKNLVRLVFAMPERTLTIKGQAIAAGRLMIFVPMEYQNLAPVKKGATVRFTTTIAPIDPVHPSVSAQPGKDGGKGFLLIFTKGGTILK